MGIYRGYFRQSAQLKRVLYDKSGSPKLDKYGNPSTSGSIPIKVFKTVSTIPVQSEAGTEYVQKNAYYVDGDVSLAEGDFIDNRRVDTLNTYYDIHGKLQYYVATVGV
jgi:hypothetical protein